MNIPKLAAAKFGAVIYVMSLASQAGASIRRAP
jgi:hypothetical protein